MTPEPEAGPGLLDRVRGHVQQVGYGPDDPLVVGLQRHDEPPVFASSGSARGGTPLDAGSVLYTASLAKQVTAVLAALLVRDGRLDLEAPLDRWLPELPAWAADVRVRHLLSHTGGLPEGVTFDDLERSGQDRTTTVVLDAVARYDQPVRAPGTEHRYSNAGYVCLGLVLERITGQGLAGLAQERLFSPLEMSASRFWSGPAPHPPGAAALDAAFPAALSLGDGGLWSSAVDLLRWNLALDRDELGVTGLVQEPGHLDDGTPLDYAWGVGVREHAGRRVYRHGGRWAGLCAQLVRVPGHGGLVVLALDDDEDRAASLADVLLAELTQARALGGPLV